MSALSEPSSKATVERREIRFIFGENWRRFVESLDDDRIRIATESVADALSIDSLAGRTFLDVGCGSGLFSLAAKNLSADRVHSFDYDPDSVACAESLRDRYHPDSDNWTIERGSALDEKYLSSLGTFDVVYAWGVLHHTGDMWKALDLIASLVAGGGTLVVSIYNRQTWSPLWRTIKRAYVSGPFGRLVVLSTVFPAYASMQSAADLLQLRNPFARFTRYRHKRGMSWYRDMIDWLGGYPFEVARPEEVFAFLHQRGFALETLTTRGGGHGCNEFVLTRDARG